MTAFHESHLVFEKNCAFVILIDWNIPLGWILFNDVRRLCPPILTDLPAPHPVLRSPVLQSLWIPLMKITFQLMGTCRDESWLLSFGPNFSNHLRTTTGTFKRMRIIKIRTMQLTTENFGGFIIYPFHNGTWCEQQFFSLVNHHLSIAKHYSSIARI